MRARERTTNEPETTFDGYGDWKNRQTAKVVFCAIIARVTRAAFGIRRARLEDLEAVREFTRDTFSWGDYLPDVWERWVHSKRGALLVAEMEGVVVGTVRVSVLGKGEAWLEAVRVRHAYRRRGVAKLLLRAAHAHARQRKCRVIRLETFASNLPAQRLFQTFGYRQHVEFLGFRAKPRAANSNAFRLAARGDCAACWALWTHSWVRRASRGLVPAPFGWRWWELDAARFAAEIRAQRVWVAPNQGSPRAFATLRAEERELVVTLLVGAKREARQLLEQARAFATRQGLAQAYWLAPRNSRTNAWAQAANLEFDEAGMLILQARL